MYIRHREPLILHNEFCLINHAARIGPSLQTAGDADILHDAVVEWLQPPARLLHVCLL